MRNKNYLQQPQDQNLRSTGKKSYLKGHAATKCRREIFFLVYVEKSSRLWLSGCSSLYKNFYVKAKLT